MPPALENLIEAFEQLPGVGSRTAERLALFMLKNPKNKAQFLATALENLHEAIGSCERCHNLAEDRLCRVCQDTSRDGSLLAVVEEPLDVMAFERAAIYRGTYHVLGGVISPLEGIGPDQLNIKTLLKRLEAEPVKELIIATNPTAEGEATALYLQKHLSKKLKITRLARGLPMGSDLEYADQVTLGRALEGRQLF